MTHSRPAPPEGQWALKIAPIPGMSKVLDQEDGGIVMQWVHDQVWQPCGNNDCPGIPKSPVHFAPDLADEVRRIMKCEGRLWRIEADAEWQGDHWVARAILPQDPERAKYPRQAMVYVFAVHGDYEPFRTRLGLAERYMAASDYILGEAIPDGYGFAANIQKDAEGVPRMIIGHRITMHVPRNEPEGTKERPRGEDALKPFIELRVAGTLVHHCMYGPVDHEPHEDEEDADLDDDGLLYDEDDIPGD